MKISLTTFRFSLICAFMNVALYLNIFPALDCTEEMESPNGHFASQPCSEGNPYLILNYTEQTKTDASVLEKINERLIRNLLNLETTPEMLSVCLEQNASVDLYVPWSYESYKDPADPANLSLTLGKTMCQNLYDSREPSAEPTSIYHKLALIQSKKDKIGIPKKHTKNLSLRINPLTHIILFQDDEKIQDALSSLKHFYRPRELRDGRADHDSIDICDQNTLQAMLVRELMHIHSSPLKARLFTSAIRKYLTSAKSTEIDGCTQLLLSHYLFPDLHRPKRYYDPTRRIYENKQAIGRDIRKDVTSFIGFDQNALTKGWPSYSYYNDNIESLLVAAVYVRDSECIKQLLALTPPPNNEIMKYAQSAALWAYKVEENDSRLRERIQVIKALGLDKKIDLAASSFKTTFFRLLYRTLIATVCASVMFKGIFKALSSLNMPIPDAYQPYVYQLLPAALPALCNFFPKPSLWLQKADFITYSATIPVPMCVIAVLVNEAIREKL